MVTYRPTALCAPCDAQRPAVGRAHAPRRLPGAGLVRLGDAARGLADAAAALDEAASDARTSGRLLGTDRRRHRPLTRQAAQQRWRQA